MKRILLIAALVLPAWAGAQAPSGISVDQQPARVNQPVKVTVNFEAALWLCGLWVDFGDGDVRHVVAERFPMTLVKHYVSPGRYVIRAEGRALLRGLSSSFACAGAPRSVSLSVLPSSRSQEDAGARRPPEPVPVLPPSPAPAPRPRDDSLEVF